MAELIPYGAAHTLYFPLVASGTQALSTAASGSLTGTNIQYSIDGGAFAASTNTGTVVGSGWYKVVLDASETTGAQVIVAIAGGTLGTVVEAQNFIFKTFGNASAFYPSNVLGTALTGQTIGTVSFVATGTVTASTLLDAGTPAVNVVSLLSTAIAGTQGTIRAVVTAGTVGTVTGTVTATGTMTVTGTPAVNLTQVNGTAAAGTQGTIRAVITGGTADANLVSILATAVVATAGTLTRIGTAGTALGTITASGTVTASTLLNAGTPAVNVVTVKGTTVAGTQGTLIVVAASGSVSTITNPGTYNANVVAWLGTAAAGTQGTPAVSVNYLTTNQATLGAVPNASTSVGAMVSWMYLVSRNQLDQTTGSQVAYNDGGTAIATATVSDDGGSYRRGAYS